MKVTIVIPNYNGLNTLRKHLPAVIAAAGGAQIIIVDDKSSDASVEFVHKNYRDIRLLVKDVHDGFASTVNRGVLAATGDIVILLNSDIEPESGFLKPLLTHFSDNLVFAVGCHDKSHENGQVVDRGAGYGWWQRGYYLHKAADTNAESTSWVSGGSGAFRKKYWQELGGMDQIFNPFYWEDIDLSYRAVERGYRVLFEPRSIVHHFHETGSIKTQMSEHTVKRIAYRNQFLFIWKHCRRQRVCAQHFLWTAIYLITYTLRGDFDFLSGLLLAAVRKITEFNT